MVASQSALSTVSGAETVFSLSAHADASVNVLNVAGRPVASVLPDRPSEAGMRRVVWNVQSDSGTMEPAGTYIVRIAAGSADGATPSVVTPLRLRR